MIGRIVVLLLVMLPGLVMAKPLLVIVSAEPEYRTKETLPKLCREELATEFEVALVTAAEPKAHRLSDNWRRIGEADVLVLSLHRRALPADQLAMIQAYVKAGKPVVAVRTASHGFAMRKNQQKPAAGVTWEAFDGEVLGGSYHGHYGKKAQTTTRNVAVDHPLLKGVKSDLKLPSWLYKVRPLKPDCTVLVEGRAGDSEPEPVAWIRTLDSGSRVFYSSLGHWDDFKDPSVVRLFVNGIRWAAGKK